MSDFKNVLIKYLEENKDSQGFDVDFQVFKDFEYEEVATAFEELIAAGKVNGYADHSYYQPHIRIESINIK